MEPRVPRISAREFEQVPLRVHELLVGVPLHDLWAVDLPRTRSGITLDEFLRKAGARLFTPSPVVRALLNIRFFVGGLLGWDREPAAIAWESFATHLTTADISRSLRQRARARDYSGSYTASKTSSFSSWLTAPRTRRR